MAYENKGSSPKKSAGVESGLSFVEGLNREFTPGDTGEGQRPTNKGTVIKK